LRSSPILTILIGRGFYQVGVLAIVLLPSTRLSNADFEKYTVAVVVPSLVILSTGIAFHGWIIREWERVAFPLRSISALSALVFPISLLVTLFLAGPGSVIVALVTALTASLQSIILFCATGAARKGNSKVSALIETSLGLSLIFAAVFTKVTSAGRHSINWAVAGLLGSVISIFFSVYAFGEVFAEIPESTPFLGFSIRQQLLNARTMITLGTLAAFFNRGDFLIMTLVATETQTTRYAVASRLSGLVLVGLSSLNNSLYLQQVRLREDAKSLHALNRRWSWKLGLVALGLSPLLVLTAEVAGKLSNSWDLTLSPVVGVLSLAILAYAITAPWAYSLNATGRENTWGKIVITGTAINMTGVIFFGRHGATPVAACWLGTQLAVLSLTLRSSRLPRF
jgi:hypothetical protein